MPHVHNIVLISKHEYPTILMLIELYHKYISLTFDGNIVVMISMILLSASKRDGGVLSEHDIATWVEELVFKLSSSFSKLSRTMSVNL